MEQDEVSVVVLSAPNKGNAARVLEQIARSSNERRPRSFLPWTDDNGKVSVGTVRVPKFSLVFQVRLCLGGCCEGIALVENPRIKTLSLRRLRENIIEVSAIQIEDARIVAGMANHIIGHICPLPRFANEKRKRGGKEKRQMFRRKR